MEQYSVVVHLDLGPRAMKRLDVALKLALSQRARLIAVFATLDPDPSWFYLMHGAKRCIDEDIERRSALRETVRRRFEEATATLPVHAEWRELSGDVFSAYLREARTATWCVAGQGECGEPSSTMSRRLVESILLGAGRPVFMVPAVGEPSQIGRKTLVAWNGSREAARALHDVLPVIAKSRVLVFYANPSSYPDDATPVDGIAQALERRGIEVEVEQGAGGTDAEVGEEILSRASDFGADLIVMGAYGHCRGRQMCLGGVTRTLLQEMTIPVLMSH